MHSDQIARPVPRRRPSRGPREMLAEALLELANDEGVIAHHAEKSWASITFAGARHRVEMVFEGAEAVEAGESFIVFLPEHEFTIRGQLVADAAITEVVHKAGHGDEQPRLCVKCEILLLEEG